MPQNCKRSKHLGPLTRNSVTEKLFPPVAQNSFPTFTLVNILMVGRCASAGDDKEGLQLFSQFDWRVWRQELLSVGVLTVLWRSWLFLLCAVVIEVAVSQPLLELGGLVGGSLLLPGTGYIPKTTFGDNYLGSRAMVGRDITWYWPIYLAGVSACLTRKKHNLTAVVIATHWWETVKMIPRKYLPEEKMRQRICESSPELSSLDAKLEQAYINKERAAQVLNFLKIISKNCPQWYLIIGGNQFLVSR